METIKSIIERSVGRDVLPTCKDYGMFLRIAAEAIRLTEPDYKLRYYYGEFTYSEWAKELQFWVKRNLIRETDEYSGSGLVHFRLNDHKIFT